MMMKNIVNGIALVVAGSSISANAENWPAWRGVNGNGISSETDLPVHWTKEENVKWRVPLPEPGNSTPIIWEDHVFVTQSIGDRRVLMAFNRTDGELLWQSGITIDTPERTRPNDNPFASATPVTDGERVIGWFGSGGVVAYDFSGEELWRKDLGKQDHEFGYGGALTLHGGKVILNFGPGTREFVVALNKTTGEELWRHASATPGQDDINGTWSTPLIAGWEGGDLLIVALRGELSALNPDTGEVFWSANHGAQAKASPTWGDDTIVFSGDLESSEVAVRLGGSGDVTETHVLWKRSPPKRRIATGIIRGDYIYGVQTIGIADCIEVATGRAVWEERLRGTGADNAVWGSPMLAGDNLYVINRSGDVFVYKAASDFELVAVNSLGELTNSSIVASRGNIFVRTHEALWCIGE